MSDADAWDCDECGAFISIDGNHRCPPHQYSKIMCKARKCTRDHWHEYDVACRYTKCDGPHSLEDLKEMNKILKSEVALATPKTDKRKVVQKALAKKDKMVTIPNMFLEINGEVNLVDTSVIPNIKTKIDDKLVLSAVLKAVQDALAQSLKKGKK